MVAIEADRLSKRFGSLQALSDLSFGVQEGEIFGLLGPNGAGKSTAIRILTTLLDPTGGRATVSGFDVVREAQKVRNAIGVIPQAMTLDLELTAAENLDIHGGFYGMRRADRRAVIPGLLEMVELSDRAGDLAGTFSGGMKRRLEIARGLVHRPSVLFLDEPTTGLDPASRRKVWEILERLRGENKMTVLLTTHYMDEADQICEQIAIVDQGKLVVIGTPEALKSQVPGKDTVSVTFSAAHDELEAALRALPGVLDCAGREDGFRLRVEDGASAVPGVYAVAAKLGLTVRGIAVETRTLDDVFIHFTGKTLRDDATGSMRYNVDHIWGKR
ncbi:MAG: ATP-binding cassette domain-containing protein [Planctomycetes bacterium]|nr:ATP-binding cassette domain-containing protein [Planctomycetota bacterium]MBI3846225.1 ATP-binding cassette domain-containing protein [Planctomycetota bacterium]